MLIGENLTLPILALISHNDSNKIKSYFDKKHLIFWILWAFKLGN